MNNREILITLMLEHQLERREIADLVSTDRDTADRWLLTNESSRHREAPDGHRTTATQARRPQTTSRKIN